MTPSNSLPSHEANLYWNKTQAAWRKEQDRQGIPTIEQTVRAFTPSGRAVEVNRFDFNLAYATNSYVQLTDGSWIKACVLKIEA